MTKSGLAIPAGFVVAAVLAFLIGGQDTEATKGYHKRWKREFNYEPLSDGPRGANPECHYRVPFQRERKRNDNYFGAWIALTDPVFVRLRYARHPPDSYVPLNP